MNPRTLSTPHGTLDLDACVLVLPCGFRIQQSPVWAAEAVRLARIETQETNR